jgi:equilibrative nucleoside transporter 1/2/3
MVRTPFSAIPLKLTTIVGDYIGRAYIPSIPAFLFTSHPKILLLSCSRVLFIPLFLACNLSTTPGAAYLNSDLIYLMILIFFGITNGYVCSIRSLDYRLINIDTWLH